MKKSFTLSTPLAAAAEDQSFWLQDSRDRYKAYPAVSGTVAADVAIIGGGLTGLWSAIRLRQADPEVRVVVIEANECGSGASGRNGGQVHSWFESLDRLASITGAEEATRLAAASADAIEELAALEASGELEMDLRLDGWLWTASSSAQEGAWDEALSSTQRVGAERYSHVGATQLKERTGSGASYAGVAENRAGSLHPGKLMRSLVKYAEAQGVVVFERSPVASVDIDDARAGVTLMTPGGTVTAGKVLVATNVWASSIPELRQKMFVVDSEVIATEPIPELLDELGWTGGEAICDAQAQVLYYQRTTDGRVVFGRGSGRTIFRNRIGRRLNNRPAPSAETVAEFHRVYPALRNVRIDYNWTGGIDCVPAHVPLFGNLRGIPNVFYAIGWNGTALAQIPATSRIIASMILGLDDEGSRSGLINQRGAKSLPPEPVRFIGANIVRQAVVRKNRREIANEKPGILTSLVLRLMPKGTQEHER